MRAIQILEGSADLDVDFREGVCRQSLERCPPSVVLFAALSGLAAKTNIRVVLPRNCVQHFGQLLHDVAIVVTDPTRPEAALNDQAILEPGISTDCSHRRNTPLHPPKLSASVTK